MGKYTVRIEATHWYSYLVEADSIDDAVPVAMVQHIYGMGPAVETGNDYGEMTAYAIAEREDEYETWENAFRVFGDKVLEIVKEVS